VLPVMRHPRPITRRTAMLDPIHDGDGGTMNRYARFGALAAACLLVGCASQPEQATTSSVRRADAGHSAITIGSPAGDKTDQAYLDEVLQALQMVRTDQAQQAIDGPLSDVIDHYETTYGDRDVVVFSAKDPVRSLVYLASVASASDEAQRSE